SILNRNAQVDANGNWQIFNVPANTTGRVRVTCVNNGATQRGLTSAQSVLAGATTGYDASVTLGAVTQIPDTMTITSPAASIHTIGGTLQLTVTAHYPDNSTSDVTSSNAFTSYTTSNAGVATVTPNGGVTAIASGNALIQAINDGASAMILL